MSDFGPERRTGKGPLVEAAGLVKTYFRPGGEVRVLKELDLAVPAGQALAVVGASGAGKSTLLHLLGGLDRPTKGQVLFDGEEIFGWDERGLAGFRNKAVGFVFQFHHLLPEFSALENAMMPCLVARLSRSTARQRAGELLAQVGLEGRADHRVGELSGGEQQRVAVARALVMKPRLLLADEPTGNLDQATGRRINELIISLNRELSLTTVIATHNLELAGIMDRRIRLEDGKAVENGR